MATAGRAQRRESRTESSQARARMIHLREAPAAARYAVDDLPLSLLASPVRMKRLRGAVGTSHDVARGVNGGGGTLPHILRGVAFASAPDLLTAAHEAAHVVQQRGGVQLEGGVGQVSDRYEQHADLVAEAVVAGKSAEDLLDP